MSYTGREVGRPSTPIHMDMHATSQTFTSATTGTVIDYHFVGASRFAIQVKGVGASATSWDVRLEGSLDGISYTPLLQHTDNSTDGSIIASGPNVLMALYLRVNVAAVSLGSATGLKVVVAYQ